MSMMRKSAFPFYFVTTLVVGALLVAAYSGVLRSTSVDVAHTYALVLRLSESTQLVPNDPTLGEMNIYPAGSHLLGALLGALVGSPFMGMHLMSLLAVVLLWASCLSILYAVPGRSGPSSALALAAVAVLNFGAFRIHGAEITGNFFYAQLVAQSLVYATLAAAVWFEAKVPRAWVHVLLLGVIYGVTGIHLLPALELLGVLAGLALLDVVFTQPGARLRALLLGGGALAVGIALVVLHPAFAAMRAIAAHNGGVSMGPLGPFWSLVVVSLLVLAAAASLLRAWYRDQAKGVAYKYLALYGAAVSGLFLMQALLRYFGFGSDYAGKKYAFGLVTFLFVRLALWLSPKVQERLQRAPRLARFCDTQAGRVAVFALALVATVTAPHARRSTATADIVSAERQLIDLHKAGGVPAKVKPPLVVDIAGLPDMIGYMFSIGVARTPREAALEVYVGGEKMAPLAQPSKYGVILSSRGHSRFAAAERCAALPPGPVLVLDGECLGQATPAPGAGAGAGATR